MIIADQKSTTPKKIDPKKTTVEEEQLFTSLRAQNWNEFEGQEKVKSAIQIAITASKQRKEPLEHILLYGPPGLGKTTLSHLIAKAMDAHIRITSGPAIERSGDLAAILTNLNPGDILFIDEIHRLHKVVEETLYSAMEDYVLDIVIGKGPSARTVRLDLPRFTIIGATTRIGMMSAPLRDRFGMIHRLSFYDAKHLADIISKAAKKLDVTLDAVALDELAARSRGTPRVALKLLKRVRDVAQVRGVQQVTDAVLAESFSMLEVDSFGLEDADRRLLIALIDKHAGGPVGIETIAATISEDVGTVEEVLEPYLMQIGFLKRTPRGRMVTKRAFEHLGKKIPEVLLQQGLF